MVGLEIDSRLLNIPQVCWFHCKNGNHAFPAAVLFPCRPCLPWFFWSSSELNRLILNWILIFERSSPLHQIQISSFIQSFVFSHLIFLNFSLGWKIAFLILPKFTPLLTNSVICWPDRNWFLALAFLLPGTTVALLNEIFAACYLLSLFSNAPSILHKTDYESELMSVAVYIFTDFILFYYIFTDIEFAIPKLLICQDALDLFSDASFILSVWRRSSSINGVFR